MANWSWNVQNPEADWLAWLYDYNSRLVIIGAILLGGAAGTIGCFTLLRKRALLGDAISHATLPGIAIAFILANHFGFSGKSPVWLLLGATLAGLLGIAAILAIRKLTRLKEDAALGIVLSVFFGLGVALLGIVQQIEGGNAAGLESYIYGKTAAMSRFDVQLIGVVGLLGIAGCILFFKEAKLLCFDEAFAASRGLPTTWLDVGLMALVVSVTIVGLQAVGLILIIALLVIPAAAARFWTDQLASMSCIAAFIGAASGGIGAIISATFAQMPSGPTIVLVCTLLFLLSMTWGAKRGIAIRAIRRQRFNRSISRQHLLRAVYELGETTTGLSAANAELGGGFSQDLPRQSVSFDEVLRKRSWTKHQLSRVARWAQRQELIELIGDEIRLTKRGMLKAKEITRQHRLWELYLITHAEVATTRVDRDADAIEHVLEPEVIAELEQLLQGTPGELPDSPHLLEVVSADVTDTTVNERGS
ncbi:MAG TPA: iron chelate uptake ABC transporter family permease subunit [Pirellulaceae bacterium]|nr:iron chelate uptake ABC transporter family permease subunit [Pirellulaceae bacterium]